MSVKDSALNVFEWLAPGVAGTGTETNLRPLDPNDLAKGAGLTEAETLGLWCYIRLAGTLDPKLKGKAEALRSALEIPEEFERDFLDLLKKPMLPHAGRLSVKALLRQPPREIRDAVTTAVLTCQAGRRNAKKRLEGLTAIVFQHPSDRAFLANLKAIPGVEAAVGKIVDWAYKKPHEIALLSSALQVTKDSLPWLFDCFAQTCRTLDLKEMPRLYVAEGGLNAYTTGANEPIVVLNTGALNLLDRQELLFVLGHELGHILAGHVKYGVLAQSVAGAASVASYLTLGLAAIPLNVTILAGLYAWMRRSEFTADRAGLLACQDRETALRVMLKFSGYPPRFYRQMRTRPLVDQAAQYQQQVGQAAFDRLSELNETWGQAHPRTMLRVAAILEWIEDGSYAELLEAGPTRLHEMGERIQQDPHLQDLARACASALTAWAAEHFRVPKSVAGPIVRRMLGEQQSPAGTKLEPILRVELQVTKPSADEIRYSLIVLVHDDGRAKRLFLPLSREGAWHDAPQTLREEFIRSGARELVRLLYTAKAD